jgi:hypothetical protein
MRTLLGVLFYGETQASICLWCLRRVLFQPIIYHVASPQFCVLARSIDDPPFRLDARRMNGDGPLVSLNSCTEGVSYASVIHGIGFGLKSKG